MNATQLRIGNYILREGVEKPIQVVVIDVTETNFFTKCKPILLTEEILLKCGFVKNGYDYFTHNKNDFELAIHKEDSFIHSINCHEYNDGKPIYFLHQLQNLYFALTNEELEISFN